jgi:hypothetical protein
VFASTALDNFAPSFVSFADDDRRDCPRVPVEHITASFGGRAFAGWGDLSTGGALWIGGAPLVIRGPIVLEFAIPGIAEPVRVRAALVSSREEDGLLALHLRFVDVPFEVERLIARHVDECVALTGQAMRS